ncbi:hypothetical protein LCGC14_0960860 [marine sediment metagenome]|uniref:Uncharacterized protein n=1 Tax=marine sediment metagenome TaxID=412755 RepID=A0A0F9NEI7_9ZZZZ
MTTTNLSNQQMTENLELAKKINAYWKKQGIKVNARVELKKVPIYFEYVTVILSDDTVFKKRIILEQPIIVRSYEIVSDPPKFKVMA